ncbi:hypothetical protein [Agromyces sp. ZXT2-6]|uniref:hypothetical protein n=1 Tax=Agromyces sp. ZXT2-6 TaxID=3461153 RepID=UPI004054F30C
MIRRTRTAVLPVLALAGSLALTACAASPASSPTPSASEAAPAETPAPSPDAADGEIAAILVRADAVEYLDGSGEPIDGARDTYAEPIDAALARLADLLGDPAVETYESHFTAGTGTLYRWNGLALEQFPVEMVADVPDAPTWGVRLESASAGELELVTVDGLRVGDTVPDDLETSACNSLMAEIVGTVGVEVDGTPSVAAIRSPVYTDACE